jgi:hypothetical protein
MSDQTTGPDASGDAGKSTDYRAKYDGIQRALQTKVNDFAAKEQAWQAERSEYEAKIARLAEYEAREAQAREEADAERLYQSLKDHFEPEPTPRGQNSSREFRPREEPFDAVKELREVFNP